jgi:hypothetical protein
VVTQRLLLTLGLLTTLATSCASDSLTSAQACVATNRQLNKLDSYVQHLNDGPAPATAIAPDLKAVAGKLHDIASRSPDNMQEAITGFRTLAVRLRVDILTNASTAADGSSTSILYAVYDRFCSRTK